MSRAAMLLGEIGLLLRGDRAADRLVPPTGLAASLTVLSAAIMALLAVFALALAQSTSRIADQWTQELSRTATLRIAGDPEALEAATRMAQEVLRSTDGIASHRLLSETEQRLLLEPWFGPNLPIADLPLPRLIEIVAADPAFDAEALRQRLAAEVPQAVFDDHTAWRRPLIAAAGTVRRLGLFCLAVIFLSLAAMVALAARAALASNRQAISVARLVGAQDGFILRAFTRRFTLRTVLGAALGAGLACLVLWLSPLGPGASVATGTPFLSRLGFTGWGWLQPLLIPPLSGLIAFLTTRAAAGRAVRDIR